MYNAHKLACKDTKKNEHMQKNPIFIIKTQENAKEDSIKV